MAFINLGTRNKGTLWEYISAYSFLNTKIPNSKFEIKRFLSIGRRMPNKHCHDEKLIETDFKKLFFDELIKGIYTKEFFKKVSAMYWNDLKKLEALLKGQPLNRLSNKELASLVVKAIQLVSFSHKPMLQALYTTFLDDEFSEELKKVISNEDATDVKIFNEIKSFLLTTPDSSFVDREEHELFKIEQEFWEKHKKYAETDFNKFIKNSKIKQKILYLVENYGWFHMEYMHGVLSEDDYIENLEKRLKGGTKKSESPQQAKKEIVKRQTIFFASHKKSKYLQNFVASLHGFAFILDDSKVAAVRGNFIMKPLLEEIAGRLLINWDDILYLVLPEIVSDLLLNKKTDKELIESRKKHRAVLLENGLITYYAGEDASFIEKNFLKEEDNNGEEIKGIVGCPGVFKGRVRVINSIRDREKFIKGDVLVTHDGTAELTYFLQQAGAIVTNEGGMICHATIVARELKTPCIVGTKIATKVLKDGDMVEVDANEGVVRIIKRVNEK